MDESLKSFVHARLLRARPDVDYRSIDAYVASPEFKGLEKLFDVNLLKQLDQFLVRARGPAETVPDAKPAPAPIPPAASPLVLQELTAQAPAVPTQAVAAGACDLPPAPAADSVDVAGTAAPHAEPATPAQEPLASMAPDPRPIAASGDAEANVAAAAAPVPPAPARAPVQEALPPQDLPDTGFRLPNGRAGSAYAHRLEAIDGAEPVVFDEVAIPPALALAADLETGAVSGTPPLAGDYTITVTYHYARQSSSRRRRAHVPVAVAPDPRTMWQNLPSDRNDPYWKEDEQHSSVRGPQLSIVAASKRGRSHAHVGSFRDDDYRIEHVADPGWYVAVVADGAGSARYSRRGAAIICEQAKKHILESLTDSTVAQIDALAQAYAQARSGGLPQVQVDVLHGELQTNLSRIVGNAAYWAVKAIHDETQARRDLGGVLKDYSSTALISVCKRYDFGTLCAAYWIGDGAIGIYSKRDGVTLLGDVDSGEFSGQTRFLDNAAVSQEVLLKRTRFALVDDMTALVLMTDGVSDAKFETEARLARAADWHAFWGELEQAVGFADPAPAQQDQDQDQERRLLDWLDFWSQGNHDDRTIAVIY